MAEEQVVKKKRVIDPNSAAYKLGQITNRNYTEAWEAKNRGEKIGWCSSNFPQELHRTLGVAVVYPENQAVAIAVRGAGSFSQDRVEKRKGCCFCWFTLYRETSVLSTNGQD